MMVCDCERVCFKPISGDGRETSDLRETQICKYNHCELTQTAFKGLLVMYTKRLRCAFKIAAGSFLLTFLNHS